MISLSRIAFLLVLVCACHRVFGLERDKDAEPDATIVRMDAQAGCWTVGQDGNEDGDLAVDGCDPCPADVDASVTDIDLDGVGDQCDPAIGPAHAIAAFDGFAKLAAWTPVVGTWMRTDADRGEYVQLEDAGATRTELAITPVMYPTIDVRFIPGNPCPTPCGAGVELPFPAARVTCLYEYRNGSDLVGLYINDTLRASSPFDAAGPIQIRLDSLPGLARCQAFSGGASGLVTAPVQLPPAIATIGLVTKDDTARYQSVTVFATQ